MAKPANDEENLEDEEEVVVDDDTQEDDSKEDLQDDQEEREDEHEEDDDKSDDDDSEEEGEPEDKKISRREALRVEALLKKYGDPTAPEKSSSTGIDFSDDIEADADTLKALQDKSQKHGDSEYNRGLETAKFLNWNTNLKIETPIVHQKHPQMGDERINRAVNAKYLNFVGYDAKTQTVARPQISYDEFVDAEFEQAEAIAELMTEKSRRSAKRQASRTALRPDGSSAKVMNLNKPVDQMSDDELAAYGKTLGFATAPKK